MENFENRLKASLFPLYQKLLDENSLQGLAAFCVQWGREWGKIPSSSQSPSMLFIGKATNGWGGNGQDVNIIFDPEREDGAFARKDQMEWVENMAGRRDVYNTNKSAFWRMIREISTNFFPNHWWEYVAWSNLYKLAPAHQGNPSAKLRKAQLESCKEILETEIQVLSPQNVVFFTSGWETDFLKYLNGGIAPTPVITKGWDKYFTSMYEIKERKYIVSPHPQGKRENVHRQVICEMIST